MKPSFVACVPLFFWLTVLVTTSLCAQISDSPGSVNCPPTVNLTVTVTTENGTVIPNTLVILKEDTSGQPRAVVFKSELRTDETGKAKAAVPCNYLDVLVAHDGFAPAAQKFLITQGVDTLSVPLRMYPIVRTTELPAIGPEAVPERRNPTKFESPDHRFIALVAMSLHASDESRVSILAADGHQLRTHGFSSSDRQHGYGADAAQWTPDSQYFVLRMRSSGGHSPTFAPIVFWSQKANRFYSLNDNTADIRFSVAAPDRVKASTWPGMRPATVSLHTLKETDVTELP